MYLSESLQKKWGGVLDHPDLPKIDDPYKKAVTAVILENQAVEMGKSQETLQEVSPTNFADTGGFGTAGNQTKAGFDPILISLVLPLEPTRTFVLCAKPSAITLCASMSNLINLSLDRILPRVVCL